MSMCILTPPCLQCVHTLDWIHSEGHTGVIRHLQANHWKMVSAADDKTLKVGAETWAGQVGGVENMP